MDYQAGNLFYRFDDLLLPNDGPHNGLILENGEGDDSFDG